MNDFVEQGDYGMVWVPTRSGEVLAEYDGDEWKCDCQENGCTRNPRIRVLEARQDYFVRLNLLTRPECDDETPCEACGCSDVAICYRRVGDVEMVAGVDFFDLRPAVADARQVTAFPEGPCVYLAQMMPDLVPRRIKVGFSANIAARLKAYRTGCPGAQMIAVRAGSEQVERALLVRFSRAFLGLGGEVFEVSDVGDALELFESACSAVDA